MGFCFSISAWVRLTPAALDFSPGGFSTSAILLVSNSKGEGACVGKEMGALRQKINQGGVVLGGDGKVPA